MRIDLGKAFVEIPVPHGWTMTQTPGVIEISGSIPDTTTLRNRVYKCTFTHDDSKINWHGAVKVSVRQEQAKRRWDALQKTYVYTGAWRKAGKGGWRLAGTVLYELMHEGRYS